MYMLSEQAIATQQHGHSRDAWACGLQGYGGDGGGGGHGEASRPFLSTPLQDIRGCHGRDGRRLLGREAQDLGGAKGGAGGAASGNTSGAMRSHERSIDIKYKV